MLLKSRARGTLHRVFQASRGASRASLSAAQVGSFGPPDGGEAGLGAIARLPHLLEPLRQRLPHPQAAPVPTLLLHRVPGPPQLGVRRPLPAPMPALPPPHRPPAGLPRHRAAQRRGRLAPLAPGAQPRPPGRAPAVHHGAAQELAFPPPAQGLHLRPGARDGPRCREPARVSPVGDHQPASPRDAAGMRPQPSAPGFYLPDGHHPKHHFAARLLRFLDQAVPWGVGVRHASFLRGRTYGFVCF